MKQATVNYRVYGNKNGEGWIKITEVNRDKEIPIVLKEMSKTKAFVGYIVIRHNFDLNQDEPYTIGDFYTKSYRKRK